MRSSVRIIPLVQRTDYAELKALRQRSIRSTLLIIDGFPEPQSSADLSAHVRFRQTTGEPTVSKRTVPILIRISEMALAIMCPALMDSRVAVVEIWARIQSHHRSSDANAS